MLSQNIAKKAKKAGHKISYQKYIYWDNVLYINNMAIAQTVKYSPGSTSLKTDFKYHDVEMAIAGDYLDMTQYFDFINE